MVLCGQQPSRAWELRSIPAQLLRGKELGVAQVRRSQLSIHTCSLRFPQIKVILAQMPKTVASHPLSLFQTHLHISGVSGTGCVHGCDFRHLDNLVAPRDPGAQVFRGDNSGRGQRPRFTFFSAIPTGWAPAFLPVTSVSSSRHCWIFLLGFRLGESFWKVLASGMHL